MPRSARSLALTDAYRARVAAARARAVRGVEAQWRTLMPRALDGDAWTSRAAAVIAAAQAEAVRASAGYLTAFLASETGRRPAPVAIASRQYAGAARDGRPLAEALQSPLIGAKAAIGDGMPLEQALAAGLVRARRAAGFNTDQAARRALLDAIHADPRFTGWRRAVRGTCGACLAAAEDTVSGSLRFEVHDNCQCVSEPAVAGVPDTVQRLSGAALFARMTIPEQDQAVGPDAAAAIRDGTIALADLKKHSPMQAEQDWITQAPLEDLTPTTLRREGGKAGRDG